MAWDTSSFRRVPDIMPRSRKRYRRLKNFPAQVAEIRAALPLDTNIEIWFQDEARIGQKNKITRRWAKKGTRPQAPKDQNIWQFMRDNWLSNRVFSSYNDIVDHCCFAWNQLTDQPWKIMSIGLRDWAHE